MWLLLTFAQHVLRMAGWPFSWAAKRLHFVGQLQLCVRNYVPPLVDDPDQDTSVLCMHFPSLLYLETKQPGHRDCCTQHPSVACSTVWDVKEHDTRASCYHSLLQHFYFFFFPIFAGLSFSNITGLTLGVWARFKVQWGSLFSRKHSSFLSFCDCFHRF